MPRRDSHNDCVQHSYQYEGAGSAECAASAFESDEHIRDSVVYDTGDFSTIYDSKFGFNVTVAGRSAVEHVIRGSPS